MVRLILLLMISNTVYGSSLLWLEIRSSYRYKDVNGICSNESLGVGVYLSAELNSSGEISEAYLHTNPTWPLSSKLKLKKEEIDTIALYQDVVERYWIEQFELSPRQLFFIMKNTDVGAIECLKTPLKDTASEILFKFDLEGVDDGVKVAIAPTLEILGTLVNNKQYRATMLLNQRQY